MDEMDALRAELEHYKAQRQKIRDIVGQIGGKTGRRRNTAINAVFLILVLGAFAFDLVQRIVGWETPYLPPALVLEVAVLLVSLKIIWMIHGQTKVDHFQFWILNSIEFQMNMLSRRLIELDDALRAAAKVPPPGGPPDDPGPA